MSLAFATSTGHSAFFFGVAPMEIDRFEKGGKKGNQKVSPKEKIVPKGKSKGKNDAGKGKGHW